jgi:hypothetical protein
MSGETILEYCCSADDLEALYGNIVGLIEVIVEFRCRGHYLTRTKLRAAVTAETGNRHPFPTVEIGGDHAGLACARRQGGS